MTDHCCRIKRAADLGRTSPFGGEAGKVRNRRILLVAVRSGEGPLTEPITATQAQPPERVFMPLKRPCRRDRGTARSGGLRAFAIGVVVAALAPIPDVRT